MGKNEKISEALKQRGMGYNCAQTVLMPFGEELKMDKETLAKLSAGLGGGVGQGEICGVANALAIAEGLLVADSSPEGKKKTIPGAKRLGESFSSPYGGCITCRDLKGKCGKPCEGLVAEGVGLLYDRIYSSGKI